MMLGVITATGDKLPHVCFDSGYQLTAADYLVILQTEVLP